MKENVYLKYRWFVLVVMLIATIGQGMLLIAPSPLVAEVAKTLNMDLGTATASAMMPFTLFICIGGIVGGVVMDKVGVAKTLLACTLIAAISALLMPILGKTAGAVIVLRSLQGFGCGPVIASGPRVAAEWFPKKQRGLFQGLQGAALNIGITIGLMVGPQIAAGSGWQPVLSYFGIVMLIAFILFIFYVNGPKSPGLMEELEIGHTNAMTFRNVLSLPVFWYTLVAVFALCWVMQGYNDLTPGHLAVPTPVGLGLGAKSAGSIMGMYTLAFTVGSLVSGFVAEKIFKGKYKTAVTITFILTAIFCASVMLPVVKSSTPLLIICLLLAGFFMGMPNPICMTFISTSYPEQVTGTVGGITMGIGIFGGTIAVAAGSFALHATGMYIVSISIVSIVAIIGAIAAQGVKAPKELERYTSHNNVTV